jgi:glucose-6-phosphate 1-epimerase
MAVPSHMLAAGSIELHQEGPLPYLRLLSSEGASATVYLQGAHVASWQPAGQTSSVLFVSSKSAFKSGAAIRGGVPICTPWFGPRQGRSDSPAHGFARTRNWTLESSSPGAFPAICLLLSHVPNDEASRSLWPLPFHLRLRVRLTRDLELALEMENAGGEPFSFEAALHTYFAVGDVRAVSIDGLSGLQYVDKVDGGVEKTQAAGVVQLSGETDRIYKRHRGSCTIADQTLRRRITVRKEGSNATVVWNPWSSKGDKMADMGPGEWQRFVCVESANAGPGGVVEVPAHGRHVLRMVLAVGPLQAL